MMPGPLLGTRLPPVQPPETIRDLVLFADAARHRKPRPRALLPELLRTERVRREGRHPTY